jgi:F-type H+-transporting ATPase subunit delta
MAEAATIARPYARAAFQSASAAGGLAKWSEVLARASACIGDPRVAPLIGSPRVSPAELVRLLTEVAGVQDSGQSGNAAAQNFLRLLTENRRLKLLPYIATQYEQMRSDAENTIDVTVVSAMALSPEQADKLSTALAKRLKRQIKLHTEIDPQLIGGAIVRAGDFVTDGSLRGRLERLAIGLTSA